MTTTIACNMAALGTEERRRYGALVRKLHEARSAHRETEDGYELVLDRTRLSLSELEEWIALESRCCPFLDFTVALRLGGGEGVKPFLREEFGLEERKAG